jgi:hypothetical protein
VLEMAAGAGLLAGLRFRPLLLLAAGGLAMMMLAAILVRLRVRDSMVSVIPAALLFALNLFILLGAARKH